MQIFFSLSDKWKKHILKRVQVERELQPAAVKQDENALG